MLRIHWKGHQNFEQFLGFMKGTYVLISQRQSWGRMGNQSQNLFEEIAYTEGYSLLTDNRDYSLLLFLSCQNKKTEKVFSKLAQQVLMQPGRKTEDDRRSPCKDPICFQGNNGNLVSLPWRIFSIWYKLLQMSHPQKCQAAQHENDAKSGWQQGSVGAFDKLTGKTRSWNLILTRNKTTHSCFTTL